MMSNIIFEILITIENNLLLTLEQHNVLLFLLIST